jgi:RNA polymerase sigma-70 factor, ECF subfamily
MRWSIVVRLTTRWVGPESKGEPFGPPRGILSRLMFASRPKLQLVHSAAQPLAGAAPDFDWLFERYAGYVARVAARMLGRDDADVDDVVQEVFLITLHRLHRIRSAEAARPWLMTVTVRTVQRTLRRRKWRRKFLGESTAAEVPATGLTADQRALLVRIYRTLDEIDPKSRIAWILRHIEGERLEDVADACGCSLATAKRRIATAQAILMEVLQDG